MPENLIPIIVTKSLEERAEDNFDDPENILQPTTTTKPFVPSIWGRLHEPKENYTGSDT